MMNALALRNPWAGTGLESVGDEIDSIFRMPFRWTEDQSIGVPVDIDETDDAYVMSFDVPGMDKKNISVEVEDGVITVSGERKSEETKKENGYTYRERRMGSFSRSFKLPSSVKESEVVAKVKDGTLEVRLPKAPEAKPKRISVE